ncbi:Sulfurtransferase TusD [Buchnera aphidicola (Pterocallis alni)]|uniref:sulfurtransferase complex subunit TusD n=1 Tax=Buchnera aphidicola TaxID=9 RepID=UPI003464BD1E
MLLYTILVTSPLCGKENTNSALLFCQNLLKSTTCTINDIFFYGDGVFHANNMIGLECNEFRILNVWCKLSKNFNINLNICSNSAQERGIITNDMAKELGLLHGNLHKYFNITGLGVLVYNILKSDRFMQF